MAHDYVIAQIEIPVADGFQAYREGLPAAVTAFGGEFLTQPGRSATVEGEAPGTRAAILRFPRYEQAKARYSSDAYAPLIAMRAGKANCTFTIVEGK